MLRAADKPVSHRQQGFARSIFSALCFDTYSILRAALSAGAITLVTDSSLRPGHHAAGLTTPQKPMRAKPQIEHFMPRLRDQAWAAALAAFSQPSTLPTISSSAFAFCTKSIDDFSI